MLAFLQRHQKTQMPFLPCIQRRVPRCLELPDCEYHHLKGVYCLYDTCLGLNRRDRCCSLHVKTRHLVRWLVRMGSTLVSGNVELYLNWKPLRWTIQPFAASNLLLLNCFWTKQYLRNWNWYFARKRNRRWCKLALWSAARRLLPSFDHICLESQSRCRLQILRSVVK